MTTILYNQTERLAVELSLHVEIQFTKWQPSKYKIYNITPIIIVDFQVADEVDHVHTDITYIHMLHVRIFIILFLIMTERKNCKENLPRMKSVKSMHILC